MKGDDVNLGELSTLAQSNGIQPRPTYKPSEVGQLLGICHRKVLAEIHAGRIRAIRNGHRFVVPASAILEFLQRGKD